MKKIYLFFALLSPLMAQAGQLEATISCNCAQWTQSKNGEMVLTKAPTGVAQMTKLSEQLSSRLLNNQFAQDLSTQQGFATVTPGFIKLMGNGVSSFADDGRALNYISRECKKIAASDEGYVSCAVSVTFPINDNARALGK